MGRRTQPGADCADGRKFPGRAGLSSVLITLTIAESVMASIAASVTVAITPEFQLRGLNRGLDGCPGLGLPAAI